MAAAASPSSTTPSSPELALVDAALAAELRAALALPGASPSGPRDRREQPDAREQAYRALESPFHVDASDLIVDQARAGEPGVVAWPESSDSGPAGEPRTSDLLVEAMGNDADHSAEPSGYPMLPAPVDDGPDPMDAAEAALRDIRDRLTTPPRTTRRRRFRKRFTVASGTSALCALAVVATDVFFGVAQLPV